MREQTISIIEDLTNLETQIEKIMTTAAQDEKDDVKREIRRLSNRIEDILNYYGTAPRNVTATMVSGVNWSTIELLQKEVAAIRESDYNQTRANVAIIKGRETSDMVNSLGYFEQSGVVHQDARYEAIVEEICDNVTAAYRRMLQSAGTRAEEAYLEIKAAANKARNALQELHIDYSQRIKREVAGQVKELGMKLNADLEQKVDEDVDKTISETLPPLAWDLTDSLSASTLSSDEIARNDADELSKNDETFRDEPQDRIANRKDLEAMFK